MHDLSNGQVLIIALVSVAAGIHPAVAIRFSSKDLTSYAIVYIKMCFPLVFFFFEVTKVPPLNRFFRSKASASNRHNNLLQGVRFYTKEIKNKD